ncbi:MAG: hypothetical protein GXP25_06045 [Planctomycetes bacterium]|nr:hypothetical protein [Planctomycetota bacterium]
MKKEQGSALFMTMVGVVIVMGLITTGTIILLNTQTVVELELRTHGQAVSIAKAGLVEALSWFRRNALETEFNPQLDLNASPRPINDTADPSIGIVREFQVSGRDELWGRYEVRKIGTYEVKDVSYDRCYTDVETGDSQAWLVYSIGTIFQKKNEATYQTTNFYKVKPTVEGEDEYVVDRDAVKVLARAVVATEIRRFSINPPGNSAVCAHRGSAITIGSKGRVVGGADAALLYAQGTGTPSTPGEVNGPTQTIGATPPDTGDGNNNNILDDFEVHFVFPKMHKSELRAMADIYTTDYTELPNPLPNYSLVYIDGDAVFSPGEWPDGRKKRLDGVGILFVDGNLTIESSSNSMYRGLIYVTGNYEQHAPSLISGTVITCGWQDDNLNGQWDTGEPYATINVAGEGDYSEIDYDSDILDRVADMMSNYRFSRSIYVVE